MIIIFDNGRKIEVYNFQEMKDEIFCRIPKNVKIKVIMHSNISKQ